MNKRSAKRQHEFDIAYMNMAIAMSKLSYAKRKQVGAIIVSENDQVISQGFNGTPSGFDNCCENAECTCKWQHGCTFKAQPIKEVLNVEYCYNPENKNKPCQYLILTTKPEVLHAETNAITKCAKYNSSTKNATLYVTLSPCINCAKLIIQAEIKRVVYLEDYRDNTGISLLKNCNINVEKLSI